MLPEVMEICDVSEDLLEWPLPWQESEFSDLASVSINLKKKKLFEFVVFDIEYSLAFPLPSEIHEFLKLSWE